MTATTHLAAVVIVTRQLVRVDHREHLRETLAYAGDPLSWIAEWQLVPRHELDTLAVHVDESLFARGA